MQEVNAMKMLNDALCIRSLETLSTINVPLQHPSTWHGGKWLEDMNIDVRHTSTLCAQIDDVHPLTCSFETHTIRPRCLLLISRAPRSRSGSSGNHPVRIICALTIGR